jgi:hypothetical protein
MNEGYRNARPFRMRIGIAQLATTGLERYRA